MTDKNLPPSRAADQFVVRLPEGMRDKLAEMAKQNGRSMNTEIVTRLQWAMSITSEPTSTPAIPNVSGDIPYSMAQDIAKLAFSAGVSFEQMLARIFVAGMHRDAPQVVYMPILPGAKFSDPSSALRAASRYVRPDATIVSEMVTRWSGILTDLQD